MRREDAGGIWGGVVAGRGQPQAGAAPEAPQRVRIGEPLPRARMAWWPRVDVVLAAVSTLACGIAAIETSKGAYWLAALMAANWWLRTRWTRP